MSFCPFNRIEVEGRVCFDCPHCRWARCWAPDKAPKTLTRECGTPIEIPPGPGNKLANILVDLGIYEKSCDCAEHVARMNQWGTQGCRENIGTIIGWLREEAIKRNLFAPRETDSAIVRTARKKAARDFEATAEWLVVLAIDLVEESREPNTYERCKLRLMRFGNRLIGGYSDNLLASNGSMTSNVREEPATV